MSSETEPTSLESNKVANPHISSEISESRPVIRQVLESKLGDWIDYLVFEGEATESTYKTYSKEVKRFLDWSKAYPQAIERSTFVAYRNDLKSKYSPATVNLSLVAIRRYLEWLLTAGDISHNPAIGVKGIKDPDRGQTNKRDDLTPDEVRRVIAAIDKSTLEGKRDLAIVSAMAYGALRQIEVQRARIGDYQSKRSHRVLWIWSKRGSEANDYIVVNPEFETALADWIVVHPRADDPEAALFCSLHPRTYCQVLSTRHIRRIVKGYFLSAGILDASKTTHSLRNSAITAIIRAGGSLLQVQRVARHIDPKTTKKYLYNYDRLDDPAEFMIKY